MLRVFFISSLNGVIGGDDNLPFYNLPDIKVFLDKTRHHTVILGRVTYDKLPFNSSFFTHRDVVVVSKDGFIPRHNGITIVEDLDAYLKRMDPDEDIWVMGGASIYQIALKYADEVHNLRILTNCEGAHKLYIHDNKDFKLKISDMQTSKQIDGFCFSIDVYERIKK